MALLAFLTTEDWSCSVVLKRLFGRRYSKRQRLGALQQRFSRLLSGCRCLRGLSSSRTNGSPANPSDTEDRLEELRVDLVVRAPNLNSHDSAVTSTPRFHLFETPVSDRKTSTKTRILTPIIIAIIIGGPRSRFECTYRSSLQPSGSYLYT
jgi:hypothetical protein